MIENGSIVELSNDKKYIITDSSIENNDIFYLALELDSKEMPTEESVFFKQNQNKLIIINNESDIDFLKTVFVNKFLNSYLENQS